MGFMKRKKQPYGFRASSVVDQTAEQVRDGVTQIRQFVDPTAEQERDAAVAKPRKKTNRRNRK